MKYAFLTTLIPKQMEEVKTIQTAICKMQQMLYSGIFMKGYAMMFREGKNI